MKLEINRKYGLKFVLYIIKKLQKYIIGNINVKKLIFIEAYINLMYTSQLRKYISAKDVIISGAMNITYTIYPHKFVIEIDSNQILYGTDAKLCDMCKLINYGVLGVSAYPIFTESFDYFKENLNVLFEQYLRDEE